MIEKLIPNFAERIMDKFSANGLSICAFLFMIFLLISGTIKVKDEKGKIKKMNIIPVISIMASCVLEMSLRCIFLYLPSTPQTILVRLYILATTTAHISIFHLVFLSFTEGKIKIKHKEFLIPIIIIAIILLFKLPIHINGNSLLSSQNINGTIITGTLKTVSSIIIIIVEIITSLTLLHFAKDNKNINIIPLFALFAFYGISIILRKKYNIELFQASYLLVAFYYIIIMTFENRDLNTSVYLNQKNKELLTISKAKAVFTEKFMCNIKNSSHNVVGLSSILKNETSDDINKDIKVINKSYNNIKDQLNEVEEINNIIKNKILINNENYNIKDLFTKLENDLQPNLINDKKLEINLDPNLKNNFIGDKESLYKSLYYLLLLVIENTKEGNIIVNINGIEENNTYKLNITINNPDHKITKEIFEYKFIDYALPNINVYNIKDELLISKYYLGIIKGTININNDTDTNTTYTIVFNQEISKEGE